MRKTAKEKARTLKNTLDFVFLGVGLYVALASLSVCPVFHCVCVKDTVTGQTAQQSKMKKKGQYLSLYILK